MEELQIVLEPFPGDTLGRFVLDNVNRDNVAKAGFAARHLLAFS